MGRIEEEDEDICDFLNATAEHPDSKPLENQQVNFKVNTKVLDLT
jgi:hypothetical protein